MYSEKQKEIDGRSMVEEIERRCIRWTGIEKEKINRTRTLSIKHKEV